MFNLEEAIAKWKRQVAAAGIKPLEVLDELESHLRDEIERQLQSGADEQHAYEAAVAAIGQVNALRVEFAKLKRADEGWRKFLRVFYFSSVAFILLVNTWTLLEYEMSLLEKFIGICAASLITLCLACLPYLLNSLPAAPYTGLLRIIKLAINLVWLWPIWALLQATHTVNLEVGMIPTAILLCLTAAIGLAALAYGLNNRRRPGHDSDCPPPPFQPQTQPNPPTRPCPPDFGISLPPAQRFGAIACEALEAASEEASQLGHDFIGTEHVLLGVLKLAKGAFADTLAKIHVDHETARAEIERLISPVPSHAGRTTIPLTPRARKALQLAAREADALDHHCISAEHIFLGLLLEGSGVAALVLKKLGVHIGETRGQILSQVNLF
jgi:hypothetical protein